MKRLYSHICFVPFLSSLDLSELAKAAKKKLQSVSICFLGNSALWGSVCPVNDNY